MLNGAMHKRKLWHFLKNGGFKSIQHMVECAIAKTRQCDLLPFLKSHNVTRITVGKRIYTYSPKALAWLEAEKQIDRGFQGILAWKNADYRITLRSERLLYWHEDLGHELGHLVLWSYGDACYMCKGEEEFSEKFGLAWSQTAKNRMQARKIFYKLIKESEATI